MQSIGLVEGGDSYCIVDEKFCAYLRAKAMRGSIQGRLSVMLIIVSKMRRSSVDSSGLCNTS